MRHHVALHVMCSILPLLMLAAPALAQDSRDNLVREAHRKAQQFIDQEQQFHLGMLLTEQPHPKTVGLAETAKRDLPAAVRMLQSVDADIPPATIRAMDQPGYAKLVDDLERALNDGHRIGFSGCGATGRLAILMEAMWREGWQDLRRRHPDLAAKLPDLESRAYSIMTGGDYALIRSVENFEDFAVFGRQQVKELKLGAGDVLVAITEGGETSSVIGTVWQALDDGATTFFAFNNPAEVLARHIERSRQVIEDPRVTKLDLHTGPMGVAGSTRMQATTSELLVVGSALEIALGRALKAHLSEQELAQLSVPIRERADYPRLFGAMLEDLGRSQDVEAIAAMIRFEEDLYGRKGLITYMADACLLDIFTDTTERSPTFMLPRFRRIDDTASPVSWAFVKAPLHTTPEAWRFVLRREPRCLAWDAELYRQMNAPARLQQNPPHLDASEMEKFPIGNEDDPSRTTGRDNAAILVAIGDEVSRLGANDDPLRRAFEASTRSFQQRAMLAIGPEPPVDIAPSVFHVSVRLEQSPLRLWDHLAAKLVLNNLSTATMARMDRLVSNWMSHVDATNKKLIDRGTRLVAELAGVDYKTACYALHETMEEQARNAQPGVERPSPVTVTIKRLKRQQDSR